MNDIAPLRSTPPSINHVKPAPLPEIRDIRLDNGMLLKICHRPDLELIAFNAITRGGYAEAQAPGIASLAATMRSEGTARNTSAQIAGMIDFSGSWIMSAAQGHYTTTGIYALARKAASVMPLMRDMVFHPAFPEKELEVAARRLASKIEIDTTTVGYQADKAIRELSFGTCHPLARTSSASDILGISRNGLVAFHSQFASPASTTLFAVGRFDSSLESIINNSFGQTECIADLAPLNIQPFDFDKGGTVKNIPVKDASQSALRISLPGLPRTHKDYLALRLAVMALGGYFGSRLSKNIREDKGLTYGISASLLGYNEGGIVQIATKCSADYVPAVMEETFKEITRLSECPLSPVELQCLKQAETVSLTDITDSPFSTLDFYQTIHTGGLSRIYFDERRAAVNSITSEHIALMASRYLDCSKAVAAIAG